METYCFRFSSSSFSSSRFFHSTLLCLQITTNDWHSVMIIEGDTFWGPRYWWRMQNGPVEQVSGSAAVWFLSCQGGGQKLSHTKSWRSESWTKLNSSAVTSYFCECFGLASLKSIGYFVRYLVWEVLFVFALRVAELFDCNHGNPYPAPKPVIIA